MNSPFVCAAAPIDPGTPGFFDTTGPSQIDSGGQTECLCQVWGHSDLLSKKSSIWGTPFSQIGPREHTDLFLLTDTRTDRHYDFNSESQFLSLAKMVFK